MNCIFCLIPNHLLVRIIQFFDILFRKCTNTNYIFEIFILADPDHYKDFLSVYGTQTSEKFRPSKAGQPEADDLPQGIFNNNRVREFVECDFCGKIRCIYSMNALKKEQISVLQLKIDDTDFYLRDGRMDTTFTRVEKYNFYSSIS